MTRGRRVVVSVVLVGLAAGVMVGAVGSPVDAQASGCEQTDAEGLCLVEVPVPVPGGGSSAPVGDPPTGPGRRSPGPDPACVWTTVGRPSESTLAAYPDAPPDAVWQVLYCGSGGENSGQGFRWVPVGGGEEVVVEPPAPEVLAQMLLASVRAEMAAPTLGSDPELGVSSVVNAPVFVEVTNWQGEIVEGPECVFFVCVTMTASPTLTFDPGDGSAAVVCEPPGSRYVPGGASLAEQAEGACAHIYRLRTGVEGRPAEWPGSVSVSWDVSWTSTIGGAAGPSGSFDPVVLSTALPRAVDEVSTVVVDGES